MQKRNRFANFIKSNMLYIIAVAVVALVVAVVAIASGGAGNIKDDVKEPTVPVDVPSITYNVPLKDFTVIKEYSDTELMYNATLKRWEAHKAIDLGAEAGANVVAVADGKVTQVYTNYLEGTVIVIEHSNNMKSLYSSLDSDVKVKVGDTVKSGDVIGQVGTSANGEHTDGAHLHFEFYRDGVKVNPNDYIAFAEK